MPRRFICAGSLNVDIGFTVERMPHEHEKLRCDSALLSAGGSAANTAHWLAGLGLETAMLGCVGFDPFGQWCVDALAAAGVNVDQIQRVDGAATGMATIFTNPADKRMVTAGGANRCFIPRQVPDNFFDRDSHLHVATTIGQMARDLLRMARGSGATTSCDLDGLPGHDMAPLVDYCFINHTDLQRALGPVEPRDAWNTLDPRMTLVVTRGERGATAVNERGEYSVPAVPVGVIDRTGGGDAFDAGFLYGLSRGNDLTGCLRLGLQLAARVVAVAGARPLSVDLDDLAGDGALAGTHLVHG